MGVSLLYSQVNLVQIFLHVLGCLFTIWFILEQWSYVNIWPIWVFFGLFPFLLELGTVGAAITFSINVEKNRKGMFKW